MKELGLDLAKVQSFFSEALADPYVLVTIGADKAAEWTELLGVPQCATVLHLRWPAEGHR